MMATWECREKRQNEKNYKIKHEKNNNSYKKRQWMFVFYFLCILKAFFLASQLFIVVHELNKANDKIHWALIGWGWKAWKVIMSRVHEKRSPPEKQSGCCNSWFLYWLLGKGELVHSCPAWQQGEGTHSEFSPCKHRNHACTQRKTALVTDSRNSEHVNERGVTAATINHSCAPCVLPPAFDNIAIVCLWAQRPPKQLNKKESAALRPAATQQPNCRLSDTVVCRGAGSARGRYVI